MTSRGGAYIYQLSTTSSTPSWVQKGPKILGTTASENLGSSVSLSNDGTRVVVGSPLSAGELPVIHQRGKAAVYFFDSYYMVWSALAGLN